MARQDHKTAFAYRMYSKPGPGFDQALPLRFRDDRILAQRLAYALRHPHSPHAVLIDIDAAAALLARVAPAPAAEEVE